MFNKNKSNKLSNKKSSATDSALTQLWRRGVFLLSALVIFRIGSHIPVPGLDPTKLVELFSNGRGGIFGLFNLFSGGSLSRLSVFSLGIMPYISASIIIQLLTMAWPSMEQLKKEGQAGKRKISQYTRYLALGLSTFQSIGMAKFMSSTSINPDLNYYVTVCVTLVTGTMFLMWLGEQITERGLGNGVSLIILAGIVANLPNAIFNTLERVRQGDMHVLGLIGLLLMLVIVIAIVVFVERGQRLIRVHHTKKQPGKYGSAAPKSHIHFKINIAGVIPPIFASSVILFPATISQWFGKSYGSANFLTKISYWLTPGQPLYVLLFGLAIVFFCFFYTALVFNPKEAAENLQKDGAIITGTRPGEQTAAYIDEIVSKLTVAGAIYITCVALLPEFLVMFLNVPFYFGGTSLLIIVVVVMEFMAQVQTYLMSHQYKGLMRKARLKI
jgi:preprotein translocase subunit SecY